MKFASILGMIGAAIAITARTEKSVKYVSPTEYLDQAADILKGLRSSAAVSEKETSKKRMTDLTKVIKDA